MSRDPTSLPTNGRQASPPALPPQEWSRTRSQPAFSGRRLLSLLAFIGLGSLLLHCFPPGQARFYPPCLFHRITGFQCSGCGATRAVYFLLHGELQAAWHHHALLVLLAPLALVWTARAAWRWMHWLPVPILPWHPWSVFALLAALALFGVLRNLSL